MRRTSHWAPAGWLSSQITKDETGLLQSTYWYESGRLRQETDHRKGIERRWDEHGRMTREW